MRRSTPRPLTPRRRPRNSLFVATQIQQREGRSHNAPCTHVLFLPRRRFQRVRHRVVRRHGSEDGYRRWRLRGGVFFGRFVVAQQFERFIVRRLGRGVLRQRVVWVILWSHGWRFAGARSAYYVAVQPVRRGPRGSRRWPSGKRRGRRRHQRRRAMLRDVQRDVRWHQFRRQLRMSSGHLRVLRAHYDHRAVRRLPGLPRTQFGVQRVRTLRFSALSAAPTASTGWVLFVQHDPGTRVL
jgi:hypothetical protein